MGLWLEAEAQLALQRAPTTLLVNATEVVAIGNRQRRIGRLGMVQNVLGIESDLDALGFANLERLAEIGIESVASQSNDGVVAQSSAPARRGMLENDHRRPGLSVFE